MPIRLPLRCLPDSIREFLHAARQRVQDAHTLIATGRRTAAIYLWGYTAEMLLKAAYFRCIGHLLDQAITPADLRLARVSGIGLGIVWPGNFHHLENWAQLLVLTRATIPGWAYPLVGFGNQVVARARQVHRLWNETLRYHKNVAYPHEVEQVQAASEWFVLHFPHL